MAAKPIPPHIEALIKQYQQSQINLVNMIATQEAKGNVTAYRKLILNDVNQELKVLNEYAEGWAQKYIPKAYTEGTAQTYEAYRAAQLSVPAVAVNQTVVNTLVQNALGMLTDATQFVGRRINDEVRKAGIEAIASKVSTGSTALQAKKNLIQSFTEKGITAIRDKTGREIKLDVYAELVARTTTREATNKGMISVVEGIGRDLVKMSHHATACPICAPLEGRIYSVSGKDKRYPSLMVAFPNGYATVHPNCRHVLMPYIEEFDDNFDENLASSNRPFKLDEEQTKKLDSYYKNQKVMSDRRTDRNEWERAKLAAPDLTPKTFSGYRAGKKANSPTYQTLNARMKLEAPPLKLVKPTLQIVNVTAIKEKEIVWGGHIPSPALRQNSELAKYWGVSVQEAQDTRVTISKYTEFVSDAKKIRAASVLDEVQLKTATVQQLKARAAADQLEKIIETGPSFKGQLNRGMIVKTSELQQYTKAGSIIDTRGMTSWTSDVNTAESFARIETAKFNAFGKQVGELNVSNKNSVILIGQDFKYSTSIDELGPFKMDEVLVSKKVNFEVTKVTSGTGRSKGTTYIYVKEVLK